MGEDGRRRLIDNLASSLAQVSREEIVSRAVGHFTRADAEYGRRLTEAIATRRRAGGR